MSTRKPSSILPIVLALATLSTLSACGGGGGDPSPPPISLGPTPTPLPTPAPPAPAPAPAPPPAPTPAPAPVPIALAPTHTPISAAAGLSQPYWPAWSVTGTAAIDGVACAATVNYHIHAMLSIYKDGVRLALPGSIGRNQSCDYEMHTHDGSGVVHIESGTTKPFSMGQFFAEWGQPLSASAVAGLAGTPSFYIVDNEKIIEFTGDPATIDLSAHREILIVTGTPPAEVPRYDWTASGL